MNKTIAVEEDLSFIGDYLTEKGYTIENINLTNEYDKQIEKYDALVVTGMNRDFLGMQDTVTQIPVIDAKGLSKEEVYDRLETYLKQ